MKKVFTLSLMMVFLALSITQLDAQTPRMAFYEEITQASCPPCAGYNPPLQNFINSNAETTLFMAYQVWWPGFDPMYLDNPEEVADRVIYYGINSAPNVAVQGEPTGQTYNQTQVNNITAQMSEFAMTLEAEIVNGILQVTGNVEASMAASGDFRLRIALSEELITIQQAPGGTNGETEYHHVFKRFVGGSAGIDLQNDWAVGDMYEVDASLSLASTNIYDTDQLEVIAWIQNDDDQFIHQATKVDHVDLSWTITNNVTAVRTEGIAATICNGSNTIAPVFTLANLGSDMLTSADITYSVNGGDEQTVNWTGNLAPLKNTQVTLDDITFEHSEETSTVNIMASNPNGMTDENEDDNASSVSIGSAPFYDGTINLVLITDDFANETYWQVSDDMGTVVASGGNAGVGLNNNGVGAGSPPADPGSYGNNETITVSIPLPADGCYSFILTDYWGDGICCGFGEGSYELSDAQGNVLLSGGNFDAVDDRAFNGAMLVNAQDIEFTSKFTISPNPAVDHAQVAFTVETAAVTTISIVNNLGQVVSRENLGKIATGTYNHRVDMTGLAAGLYMINITSGEVSGTQKIVVSK